MILGDNGGLPDFDTFTDMEYEVSVNNALRGNLGFVFHPAIRRLLKKLKIKQFTGDTSGEYVIAPFSDAQLESYLGYKFGMTTQIPINLTKGSATKCTELYFGNWAEVLIGQWLGFEILASNEAFHRPSRDQHAGPAGGRAVPDHERLDADLRSQQLSRHPQALRRQRQPRPRLLQIRQHRPQL